jgi:hypothetical protein
LGGLAAVTFFPSFVMRTVEKLRFAVAAGGTLRRPPGYIPFGQKTNPLNV